MRSSASGGRRSRGQAADLLPPDGTGTRTSDCGGFAHPELLLELVLMETFSSHQLEDSAGGPALEDPARL